MDTQEVRRAGTQARTLVEISFKRVFFYEVVLEEGVLKIAVQERFVSGDPTVLDRGRQQGAVPWIAVLDSVFLDGASVLLLVLNGQA